MTALFEGKLRQETFGNVSTQFENFCSSLQTTNDSLNQCMEEITSFKSEKEKQKECEDQEKQKYKDLRYKNIEEWKKKEREENEAESKRHREYFDEWLKSQSQTRKPINFSSDDEYSD
jgi:hypothetical protein